eukprot:15334682-Ditylum_brightwellii.AAC.1
METFKATRMVLDHKTGKITPGFGEKSGGRIVRIAQQPFAQGGLRNVYCMKEIIVGNIRNLVGKESRHEIPDVERLRFHTDTSNCQAKACKYAKKFNAKVKKS